MSAAGFIHIEPDDRITLVTEDGVASSSQPMTMDVTPEVQDWLDGLPDASITVDLRPDRE